LPTAQLKFTTLMMACHDLLVDCSAQMLKVDRTSLRLGLGIKLRLDKRDMVLAGKVTAEARRDADARQTHEDLLSWQAGQASCSGVGQAETDAWTAEPNTEEEEREEEKEKEEEEERPTKKLKKVLPPFQCANCGGNGKSYGDPNHPLPPVRRKILDVYHCSPCYQHYLKNKPQHRPWAAIERARVRNESTREARNASY